MAITPALWATLRKALAPLSPRRRRWQRFLRELRLDPAQLPRPLPSPSPRDFIICGAPRSGTTLLAAMLFQPPQVLTVMEPWDGMRLPPAELFASLRTEVATTGTLTRGKLDIRELAASGAVKWATEGTVSPPLDVDSNFALGVKWPAFWRYLELLPDTRFLVCVRDPREVVSSFKRKGGRLGEGLEYDIAFNREINAEIAAASSDAATRRALLYEKSYAGILPWLDRPNVFTVRYERWFTERTELLSEIGAFLGVELAGAPAQIRRSAHEIDLSDADLVAIHEHCPSAATLGYPVAS